MDNEQFMSMAVSVGEIKSTVTAIKENNERRLGNVEASVISLSSEQVTQGQEIRELKSSLSTSYKWMTALVTVIGVIVGVIMKLI